MSSPKISPYLSDRWRKVLIQGSGLIFSSGLLVIIVATLSPFNFSFGDPVSRGEIARSLDVNSDFSDLLGNLLLFIPFGLGLTGLLAYRTRSGTRSLLWVILASFCLSTTVETLQLFLPSRFSSATDILMNSLSGGLGCLTFYRGYWAIGKRLRQLYSFKRLAIGFTGYLIFICLVMLMFSFRVDLSNWNPNYTLLLGNERTQNRPWLGSVSEVALADRAFSPTEVKQIFSGANLDTQFTPSMIAHYKFTGNGNYKDRIGNLPDLSWQGQPSSLNSETGANFTGQSWLATEQPVNIIAEKAAKNSQFSLFTSFQTARKWQGNPARIVSFSKDTVQRNFTFGQDGYDLSLRLRTPLTGANGANPAFNVPGVFQDTKPHSVVLTYNQGALSCYVDSVDNHYSAHIIPGIAIFKLLKLLEYRWAIILTNSSFKIHTFAFYCLVFIPLGTIVALITSLMRGNFVFYLGLFILGLCFPVLLVETTFVTVSGQPWNWFTVFSCATLMIISGLVSKLGLFLWFESQVEKQ